MSTSLRAIDKPERQHPLHRTLWGTVTAAFWLFYFYLLLPLVTLVLWVLGVRNAYTELYLKESGVDSFLLGTLPLVALLCTTIMVAWAEYNRRRFQGHDRRQPQPDATREEIATALGAGVPLADELLATRRAVIVMDDEARPLRLQQDLPAPPSGG